MKYSSLLLLATSFLMLDGCGTYSSAKIDESTGLYRESGSISPGDILKSAQGVDLSKYRFVYLETSTTLFPARFEFYIRHALFRYGYRRVLNRKELTEMVLDSPALASIPSVTDPVSIRRLSELAGPILRISYSHNNQGVRNFTDFEVHDLSSGELLFRVKFEKLIWGSEEKEAIQAVLNEFKKWMDSNRNSTKGRI